MSFLYCWLFAHTILITMSPIIMIVDVTSFGKQRHEVIAIFDVVFMGGRGSWFVYMIVPQFPCKHEKIILQINLDVFHFDAWEMYKE